MTEAPPTVYVVDDDESIRKSLGRLLRSAGYRPVLLGSAEAFLANPVEEGSACLLLDLQMPGLTGLDLQQALAAAGRQIPIVFITGHGDIPTTVKAMKAGAVDFLPKPFEDEDLIEAIRLAVQRSGIAHREEAERRSLDARLDQLTPREKEVLALVVGGKLNKQVALELGITEKTVKIHRQRVMEKLGADSLADLVRLAERGGVRQSGRSPGV